MQAPSHTPESPQCPAQARCRLDAVLALASHRPLQGSPQVLLLPLYYLEPVACLGAELIQCSLFRQLQVIGGVCLPHHLQLSLLLQACQAILTDRLEHEQARLLGLHRLIAVCSVRKGCIADRLRYSFCGLQTAAAYKDREQTEETLLLGGEQVVAPL